jgi:adenylate cyclase
MTVQNEVNNTQWPKTKSKTQINMGIHLGEPTCKRNPVTNRMDYYGPDVNLTARLTAFATNGQILCTKSVIQDVDQSENVPLIVELPGEQYFKGIEDPQVVFQLLEEPIV